jgi:hypothetical protein
MAPQQLGPPAAHMANRSVAPELPQAVEPAAISQGAAVQMRHALEQIRELLNDWPTLRALSASGAAHATSNKRAARKVVEEALAYTGAQLP